MSVIGALVLAAALVLLAISFFFALEVAASFFAAAKEDAPVAARGRIAVVIPAHNEGAGVASTVAAVRSQLRADDRVIVIADNCSDDTALHARKAGADVFERSDLARRGKGYALQFGVDALRADPPQTTVFVDADCRPDAGAIPRIAQLSFHLNRPVQALYLMNPPGGAGPKAEVSAFAWLLMNRVRMSGLQALAGVTRLTGSGMAFPWSMISEKNLASGEIVEDLALTLAMVGDGAPPFLDLGAVVTSELASSEKGAVTQHARWEHGSINMGLGVAPKLFARGLLGDFRSLAMALDLSIPPLSLFAALLAVTVACAAVAALFGQSAALLVAVAAAATFSVGVVMAWFAYGRAVLPVKSLGAIRAYLSSKARVYGAEGRASAKRWTRTDRGEGA